MSVTEAEALCVSLILDNALPPAARVDQREGVLLLRPSMSVSGLYLSAFYSGGAEHAAPSLRFVIWCFPPTRTDPVAILPFCF